MEPALHIDHLEREAAELLAACRADPHAEVPTCAPWDRTDLLRHVALFHSWHRAQVERGPGERVRLGDAPAPPEDDRVVAWYEANVAGLVAALRTMDTEAVWPTWAGARPGTFFPRRMALETTIHRWDAVGGALDPALAADGVLEVLELFVARFPGERFAEVHGSIHLHATDVDGEWLVRLGADGITFELGHAKGDVALRGAAGDLLLWCWNRVAVDERFEVFGDRKLLDHWTVTVVV